jgi:hypothetical protein
LSLPQLQAILGDAAIAARALALRVEPSCTVSPHSRCGRYRGARLMGTKYYMIYNACASCGRGEETLHIGKSSAGWVFSLNTHPEAGIESLDDWRAAWANCPIKNEYGERITPQEMERVITQREAWQGRQLSRHTVDGRHCIARGDGTFDLMRGEFS